jgi:hypothetical protein
MTANNAWMAQKMASGIVCNTPYLGQAISAVFRSVHKDYEVICSIVDEFIMAMAV